MWLLAPVDRDTRVLRRLRLEWKNLGEREKAEELAGGEPRTSRDDTKAELQRIARACSLTVGMVSQVASSPVGFGAIVETTAAEATNCPVTGVQALYCWTAASGIAHAQRWAVMSAALQRTMVPGGKYRCSRLAGLVRHQRADNGQAPCSPI